MEINDKQKLEEVVGNHEERIKSFEEAIDLHEQRLAEHDKRLTLHEERLDNTHLRLDDDKKDISMLKQRDKEQHERLLSIERNYEKLEVTLEKENKATRETMREQTNKLYDIVQSAMNHQDNRYKQNHELKMAKMNTWSTVFLKVSGGVVALLSSGGAVYFIIEKLFLQ